MRGNEDGIKISYGPECGDCTCAYYITLTREMTVGEFIEKQLSDTREWGWFEIRNDTSKLCCLGYTHGKLDEPTMKIPYYDKKIKKCSGSGGWTRSDFVLFI